jgi:hypothetical protein
MLQYTKYLSAEENNEYFLISKFIFIKLQRTLHKKRENKQINLKWKGQTNNGW